MPKTWEKEIAFLISYWVFVQESIEARNSIRGYRIGLKLGATIGINSLFGVFDKNNGLGYNYSTNICLVSIYDEVRLMKRYNFIILIERDEDGLYIGSVPALQGCHTQAKTVEELMPRMREAIELCLEGEQGEFQQNEFVGVQQIEITL